MCCKFFTGVEGCGVRRAAALSFRIRCWHENRGWYESRKSVLRRARAPLRAATTGLSVRPDAQQHRPAMCSTAWHRASRSRNEVP